MSSLKRRSRVVNFRLSEGEYDKLRSFCENHDAHSISDVARSAVYRLIDSDGSMAAGPLAAVLGALSSKVEQLDRELKWLAQLVESHDAPATP